MPPLDGALRRLTALAASQRGLVTIPQIGRHPAARDAVEAEFAAGRCVWTIPQRVFHVREFPLPRNPRLTATWLLLEDVPAAERRPPACGVASHRSALQLYGLPGFPGPAYEFTGSPLSLRAVRGVRLHPGEVAAGDWRVVDGIPVTTPARTVRDFAASPDIDGEDLGKVVARFVRHGLATEGELAAASALGARAPQ